MCTSRKRLFGWLGLVGFTVLELLVGITLTVILVVGVSPLLVSLQAAEVRETDRTIAVLQGRVAGARLERDLRMATGGSSRFPIDGPIIEATPRQIVFLGRSRGAPGLSIIEWEVVGSSLMRRRGPCPRLRPSLVSHSLYVDHKSMMEGLAGDARFSYVVNGAPVPFSVSATDLPVVQTVLLRGSGRDANGEWPTAVYTMARVGL
jgi:hypothetical protein